MQHRQKLEQAKKVLEGGVTTISHLVCAVRKPDNTIEIIVNTEGIAAKIDYLLDAYDEDMNLKTCDDIWICGCMIIYVDKEE